MTSLATIIQNKEREFNERTIRCDIASSVRPFLNELNRSLAIDILDGVMQKCKELKGTSFTLDEATGNAYNCALRDIFTFLNQTKEELTKTI